MISQLILTALPRVSEQNNDGDDTSQIYHKPQVHFEDIRSILLNKYFSGTITCLSLFMAMYRYYPGSTTSARCKINKDNGKNAGIFF